MVQLALLSDSQIDSMRPVVCCSALRDPGVQTNAEVRVGWQMAGFSWRRSQGHDRCRGRAGSTS